MIDAIRRADCPFRQQHRQDRDARRSVWRRPFACSAPPRAQAQLPSTKFGEVVPRDVREMYDRGLQYLAAKQTEKGDWTGGGYEDGPGPVGLGLMVFLASGEDPNFGLYSNHVRGPCATSSPPRTPARASWA